MSLEDRQADAVGTIEDVINIAQEPRKSDVKAHFERLNEAFSVAYQADDEDNGDRAYDAVEALEEFADDLREEFSGEEE